MKRKFFNKAVCIALSMILLAQNSSVVTAKNNSTLNRSDFKKIESFRFIDSPENGPSSADMSDLPEKVDLRKRGVVTPVKFQNPFGSCWAFGAMAAAETSILSESGKTYDETKLDLSEKHLAWFLHNPIDDEYSSQNGEGTYVHNAVSNAAYYNYGGMRFYASSLFAQGVGPVLESDCPYQGKKGMITYSVNSDGELEKMCYSDHDDWSIDSSKRFQRAYKLENSLVLGSTVHEDEEEGIKYDARILCAIKEQINMGRGVSVGYCADTSRPNETGNTEYMNQTNWCQYTDKKISANHEVCIVGYDDAYPKENFNEEHQPDQDGAFLVKNSWGSGENTFPHKGNGKWGIVENDIHTGYFWLSYYDMTIEDFEIFDFDLDYNGKETEIIDQYDFVSYNGANTVEAQKDCEMANVFTAQYNQELREISFITSTPDTQAYYKVYLIDDSKGENVYESEVVSGTEFYEYGGYHLQKLSKAIPLKKGQKYSIRVKLVNSDNKNEIIIPVAFLDNDSSIDNQVNNYTKTIVNEGESLLKYNGQWYDWLDVRDTFNPISHDGFEADNFSIKGYSVLLDDRDLSQKKVELSQNSFEYDGLAKKPEIKIDGLTPGKDYTVSYYNNIAAGKGKVVVEGKGLFSGSATVYFSIVEKKNSVPEKKESFKNPTATKIKRLKAGKKSLQVLWMKQGNISGYQIQYSLKKNMKSAKTITIKSTSSVQKKIKKLKAKRLYYVRIRTYKKEAGKTYYSTWSNIKKAKTK